MKIVIEHNSSPFAKKHIVKNIKTDGRYYTWCEQYKKKIDWKQIPGSEHKVCKKCLSSKLANTLKQVGKTAKKVLEKQRKKENKLHKESLEDEAETKIIDSLLATPTRRSNCQTYGDRDGKEAFWR